MSGLELPELIDIGVNLTSKAFRSDLPQVIARARQAGVAQMVVTGTRLEASWEARELAARHPGVLASTAGVHPHHAREWNEGASGTASQLRVLLAHPEVVAVGECGLDFDRNFSPPADQRRAFAAQLALAAELRKPVFLHERSAHADFAAILREHRAALPRAVVHCFTGDRASLETYLELDLHIGITGWICDERRGQHLLELVRLLPPGRLMVETDAPYLLPRGITPPPAARRNEPAFLPHVLLRVAQALGQPAEQVAAATTATAREFFGLSGPTPPGAGRFSPACPVFQP
jgi:TatD DNase family protein